jgi:hypothetical protein
MLNADANDIAPQTHFTQVSSFFDIVDNMVKVGDTDKKYYQAKVPCMAPPTPISDNGWTTISLMPKGGNMVDLYNSYIYVELLFDVRFSQLVADFPDIFKSAGQTGNNNPIMKFRNFTRVWIGYKDAMDCISQYQIHCNGEEIYSQNHALRESFLTSTCMPDTVRTTDCYSRCRFEDIWNNRDTSLTGAWLVFDHARENWFATTDTGDGILEPDPTYTPGNKFPHYVDGQLSKVKIQMKIDFKRFLPLHGIKYLPAFVQNLQLKVQFSTRGMVVANPGPEAFRMRPDASCYIDYTPFTVDSQWVTNRFVPLGEPFTMWDNPHGADIAVATRNVYSNWTTEGKKMYAVANQTVNVIEESFKVQECWSMLHTFSIDRNIYLSLCQRYTESPLIFPIQTLNVSQTNGSFGTGTHIAFTHQHIPRFVDAIFYFFPKKRTYQTCFTDPELENIQISMGDFGAYRFPSSWHPTFYENIQNLLNLNNEEFGIPKDLMTAYTAYHHKGYGWSACDDTNYVFGIPTSVDNTFQQGQTSQSIVAYTLEADVYYKSASDKSEFYNELGCVPEMAFLNDSVFAIQVVGGGGVVCRIKELDITTPAD